MLVRLVTPKFNHRPVSKAILTCNWRCRLAGSGDFQWADSISLQFLIIYRQLASRAQQINTAPAFESLIISILHSLEVAASAAATGATTPSTQVGVTVNRPWRAAA